MLRRLEIAHGRLTETQRADAPVLLFIDPSEEEKQGLVDEYNLDMHTLASALDPNELGRLEFEPDHSAIIIKRPKQYSSEDNFLFKITSVGMFLSRERLILVVSEDTLRFEGKLFLQVRSLQELVLKIVFRSIHHFEEHLRVFNLISDELEGEIQKSMENRHLLNMFTLEKSLVYYVNALRSNSRVLEKLKINATRLGFTVDDLELIEDVIIENTQCHELAQTYSQVLAGLMDARVSIVSNNLNVLMKTLTLVMICIMVPNLVVSIFSMNVRMPLPEESLLSFWTIVALAIASAAGVLFVWRYKKW